MIQGPQQSTPQPGMEGAVMVMGAGIAGMQAALDCANSGFKVYLVEQQPSIGGNMARLDKTFPTNDCAMCMISPKLVETGRHKNIEIISYADLVSLDGQAGNFTARVKKRPRFVDEEKCNGCGDCERECPVLMTDTFNGELSERKAIYRMYPQAIPNVFTIDKKTLPPPCRATCPAGVNAQGYVALISKGKFLEALRVVRERMPFAGACGRICHHPCESKCNRAEIDEAVSVRNLKRFVADFEREKIQKGESVDLPPDEMVLEERQNYKETVAVVGGGPAGLTCANDLARKGYTVTLFDANQKLGGMMRTGIPSYRLPRDFLDHEIDLVLDQGVSIQSGKTLGKDITIDGLLNNGHNALFLATGAQLAKKLPIEGCDASGVLYGIPFLRDVNTGTKPDLGSQVVVIGGGNVAMDVARSARRLLPDGKISLYCLESRDEMPAHEWEIQEAIEENVEINPSWGPARIEVENGKVKAVTFKKCTAVFDENHRFAPKFDEAQTTTVPANNVLLAIGQNIDLSFLSEDIKTERGAIAADRLTLQTSRKEIFAGGDNVLGPASLVQAVEQGHRAAESIHRYLRGQDLQANREPVERPTDFAGMPEDVDRTCLERAAMPVTDLTTRKTSFTEIDSGYSEEMAVAEAKRCLNCGGCSYCLECVRACKAHAVDHDMIASERELKIGAVILTNGYELFDARRKSEYGYGRFANVVTSIQFERILSASGPYEGHLQRPSDHKIPKKIAWIQCVGSRDVTEGNDYCSSVCCMYAAKEAIIAKEHESIVEPTIFFTDIRAFGKGFEEFYNRAKDNYGVRFVRSQVSGLRENPTNKSLLLQYVKEDNGGGVCEEEFDMVVLSIGLVASQSCRELGKLTQTALNSFGFIQGDPSLPSLSSRPGIYLCGAVNGPKDIPETVMQSSAAAAMCGELLASVRGTRVQVKEYPVEKSVEGQEPRIGVFVCHCGINIASVVDVEAVSNYVQSIPGVVHAEHTLYTCSQDTQKRMKEIIQEKDLNRVIVASCTPRTHEPLFQETLRESGLNKFMFEMADIREQCSWVHQGKPYQATEKAKALVRGSVGKSKLLEPLQFSKVGVTRSALVVGGGIAGISASLSMARQGFDVVLVEKQDQLGGNLRHLRKSLEGSNWQAYLAKRIQEVEAHKNIDVCLATQVDEVNGFVGNFSAKLKGQEEREIKSGVIIIATGAEEYKPDKFLYGENERVVTQRELEARLAGDLPAKDVVMIQCVGSRDDEHPYCSRVCCGEAVKNALELKQKDPATAVTILYRDIRTYEFKETYYRRAREAGVRFVHFPDDAYPQVSPNGNGLRVKVRDTVINEDLDLKADLLVLSAANVADLANNQRLGEMLKLPLTTDGFFMEAHVKLRPVDFANEGIFVCGLAHSPKYTEENITQALAAAGRAASILSKDSLEVGGVISVVDEDKCAACLTCVRECIYSAPFINERGKAEIEAAKCQGCGNCASACPGKAIQLRTFTDKQEHALFYSILKEGELAC